MCSPSFVLLGPGSARCSEHCTQPENEKRQRTEKLAQQGAREDEAEGGRGKAEAAEGPEEEVLLDPGSEGETKSEVQSERS